MIPEEKYNNFSGQYNLLNSNYDESIEKIKQFKNQTLPCEKLEEKDLINNFYKLKIQFISLITEIKIFQVELTENFGNGYPNIQKSLDNIIQNIKTKILVLDSYNSSVTNEYAFSLAKKSEHLGRISINLGIISIILGIISFVITIIPSKEKTVITNKTKNIYSIDRDNNISLKSLVDSVNSFSKKIDSVKVNPPK